MRGHGIATEAFGEMMRHALREPAGVDENERRGMLIGKLGDAVVDLAPHFIGGHRAKLARGNFDGQIHFTAMADLYDGRVVALISRQEMGDSLDRLLRRGETDAHEPPAGEMVEEV